MQSSFGNVKKKKNYWLKTWKEGRLYVKWVILIEKKNVEKQENQRKFVKYHWTLIKTIELLIKIM